MLAQVCLFVFISWWSHELSDVACHTGDGQSCMLICVRPDQWLQNKPSHDFALCIFADFSVFLPSDDGQTEALFEI